jgi:hypothetical protein
MADLDQVLDVSRKVLALRDDLQEMRRAMQAKERELEAEEHALQALLAGTPVSASVGGAMQAPPRRHFFKGSKPNSLAWNIRTLLAENPEKTFTPITICEELSADRNQVYSVVSRLSSAGMIERVEEGEYRHPSRPQKVDLLRFGGEP